MALLYGHSEAVAEFVSKMLPGCERGFGACTAIGIIDGDGKLVAGLVYHNWHQEAGVIEISGAAISKRWLTRPIIRAFLSYPFDGIGCQMIVARVDENLNHIRRMCKTAGGDEFVIPRLGGRGKSRAILTLTDDAWRNSKFARKPNEFRENT